MSSSVVVQRGAGIDATEVATAVANGSTSAGGSDAATDTAVTTFVTADPDDAIGPVLDATDGEDEIVVVANASWFHDLEDRLVEYGIESVVRIDPRLGADANGGTRTVAAAARAALVGPKPEEPDQDFDVGNEHVLVVDDFDLAADLATACAVTLVVDGDPRRRIPSVRTVRGRAMECFAGGSDGDGITVLVDRDGSGERFAPDQVVWPGYDGDVAHRRDVHVDGSAGTLAAVVEVARDRRREPVAVDRSVCAVGRRGQPGCDACETSCPYDAIEIEVDGEGAVAVDPVDCVDCGACLAVCPTEAITSPRARRLSALGRMMTAAIETARGQKGSRLPFVGGSEASPLLAFVSESVEPAAVAAAAAEETATTVPIAVSSAARIPPALAVYALAAGADGVVLVGDPGEEPAQVRAVAEDASRTLADLGIGRRVAAAVSDDPDEVASTLRAVEMEETVERDGSEELLRTTHRAAYEFAGTAITALAGEKSERVRAKSLGRATVDADGCTLCEACSELCPTAAFDQPDASTLTLDPASCVGCGLCLACPESVVAVEESVIPAELEEGRRTVVESEAIECRECGRAFASAAGVDAVRSSLEAANVPTDVGLDVCPDCRRGSSLSP